MGGGGVSGGQNARQADMSGPGLPKAVQVQRSGWVGANRMRGEGKERVRAPLGPPVFTSAPEHRVKLVALCDPALLLQGPH